MSTQPDTTRQTFEAWLDSPNPCNPSLKNRDVISAMDLPLICKGWNAATEHAARVCERLGPDSTNAQCADAVRRGSV